jgi:pre-mRNA-splicing factor CDC5/CEF1
MIKGGIWKNTEDEILKAAVMKYGLNQWSRIATLLSRKSAKQCKARWEEWLNPAIKKTEWTKEEDEKLLHLSKILPCQWRTIAPIVGRSATQCLERYEKLLDDAMRADGAAPEMDDPRKLRPGEIDPCPESKPSRPDPIDMDEDEKEMLNEARARLANTNGKKAKRKVREKMLDEARRLATLQKRRELKAAGIGGDYKRRIKGIDYNAEIPFHHKAPAGFYEPEMDSSDKPDFLKMNRDQMDLKRQADEKEAARKADEAKLRARKKADLPSVVMSVNDIHDPFAARKRSKLDMPAPVLSDRDLEDIARTGMVANQLPVDTSTPSATNTLLGTYTASPAPTTPMRTPRTPLLGDTVLPYPYTPPPHRTFLHVFSAHITPHCSHATSKVLEEARRIARFNAASAPLKGGDTVELPEFGGGITPQRKVAATPSALISTGTPLHSSIAGTPSRGGSVAAGLTPLRDNLSINGDAASMSSEISERQRLAAVRAQLRSAFAQLPAPKNEVQIVGPDGDDEAEVPSFPSIVHFSLTWLYFRA